MVVDLFKVIGDAVTAFLKIIIDGVNAMVPLLYNTGEGATHGFTIFGTLLLVGGGVALVYWLFYLIKSLTRINVK